MSTRTNSSKESEHKPKSTILESLQIVAWLKKLLKPVLDSGLTCDTSSRFCTYPAIDTSFVATSAPKSIRIRTNEHLGDCVRLRIPYADTTRNWTFAFSWLDPFQPPLITFDDEFCPDYFKFEEYHKWQPMYEDAFVSLLHRLVDEYRDYQKRLLRVRLQSEMEMLDNNPCNGLEHFDVYTYSEGGRRGDVIFSFLLHLESVADLPKVFLTGIVDDRVKLKIKYTHFGDGRTIAEIELSSFVNQLFEERNPRLPPMQIFVYEYVEEILSLLNAEVNAVGTIYTRKKELILKLISMFPNKLVDFAVRDFNEVSFRLDQNDFVFIVKVKLLPNFRSGQSNVEISLQSVYHENRSSHGGDYNRKLPMPFEKSVTVSIKVDASIDQMADQIRNYIFNYAAEFKQKSCQR